MTRLEKLFQRYRSRGDARALGRVFDATAAEILNVARHLVRDQDTAADVLQQTWLSAIEAADRWDAERPLVPWLLGIAVNHARSARRAQKRTRAAADPSPWLDTATSREPDPAAGAQQGELASTLRRALAKVRAPYAAVLDLHLREDLEPIDIARRLERSPDTVRSQIRRGLELLRAALPAGAAGVAVAVGEATAAAQSIARVRNVVMTEALRRGATLGSLAWWKPALAAAIVAVMATVLAWPDGSDVGAPGRARSSSAGSGEATAAAVPVDHDSTVRVPLPAADVGAPAEAFGPRIRVVDPSDGSPVAGVQLVVVEVPIKTSMQVDAAVDLDALRSSIATDPLSGRSSRAVQRAELEKARASSGVRGTSDEEGHWRMPRGTPGAVRLVLARAEDGRRGYLPLLPPAMEPYVSLATTPVLAPDSTDTHELPLHKARSVRVRVVRERDGTPVPDVAVALRIPPLAWLLSQYVAVTGADGEATFAGLEELFPFLSAGATIDVALDHPHRGETTSVQLDPRQPPDQPLVLRLPERATAAVTLRAVNADGTAFEGAGMFHVSATGGSVEEGPVTSAGEFLLPAMDGVARLPRVETGMHLWFAFGAVDTQTSGEGAGPARAGDDVELLVRLPEDRRAYLVGRLLSSDGQPLVGRVARLRLVASGEDGSLRRLLTAPRTLGPNGEFRFEAGVVDTTVTAAVAEWFVEPSDALGAGLVSLPLETLAIGDNDIGTLRPLSTPLSTAGRVVTEDGSPVSDPQLSVAVGAGDVDDWAAPAESGWTDPGAPVPTAQSVKVEASLPPFGQRPAVLPLDQRDPQDPSAGEMLQLPVESTASAAPDRSRRAVLLPHAYLVPRTAGHFDVFTSGAVDRITVTATSAKAGASASVAVNASDREVSIVLRARASVAGSIRLAPDGVRTWIRVQVRDSSGALTPVASLNDDTGAFTVGDCASGEAALVVFLYGESIPVTVVEGLQLRSGEVCRDPRISDLDISDLVRSVALDVRAPGGRPWRTVADEGVVWYGATGAPRPQRLDAAVYLDEYAHTVVMSTERSLDLEVEVPGFRMVELRNVVGDRTVVLEPGIPVRVECPAGAERGVALMRLHDGDWEPNQPVTFVPLDGNAGADLCVALPGRYQVAGIDPRRFPTIDVVDSQQRQVFRIE